MPARIVSLNLAAARPLTLRGRTVLSGIFKTPVAGPVWLGEDGLSGDVQVDRRYHGGADKAVNVYPEEHFSHWADVLGRNLEPGAFGENFTTAGLTEAGVAIGDVFRVGRSVLVEVTQPRQPCGTLAARHGVPGLVRLVEQSGSTGFYLRCLEPGEVQAGDALTLLRRPREPVTIAQANHIMRHKKADRPGVERLLRQAALSADWRRELEAALG